MSHGAWTGATTLKTLLPSFAAVMPKPLQFSTRAVPADALDARVVAAWAELESRAAEPNAYLSPYFVLPALRHLTPGVPAKVFLVERVDETGPKLVGLGVFTPARASRQFPLPRLVSYRTVHSPLNGLLLDRECQSLALQALLKYVRNEQRQFKGIEIAGAWSDGPTVDALRTTGRLHVQGATPRAILIPAECEANLRDKVLAARVRDLNRKHRRLEEQGRVTWRWHREAGIPQDAVQSLLDLEHMGWKGEQGTSLRSSPAHEAFFREAIAGFASARRALITEVSLDGVPISSSCNFISGRVGFAFKIGWNPQYRAASPAQINETEFMRNATRVAGDLEYIDSGASPDSWINKLWLARRSISTLSVATQTSASHALRLVNLARRLMGALRSARMGSPRGLQPAAD